ncbi:MAG: TauD/TfdA dioxygenase family protein [Gammaproteobacteria bacterium]
MHVEPVHPLFVGRVADLDLTQSLGAEDARALHAALGRYGALVIHTPPLTDRQFEAFGAGLGPLFDTSSGFRGSERVIRIGNVDTQGRLLPEGHHSREANVANDLWHVDNTFSEPPAMYSALMALTVPPEGGETEFADARAAYDDLPQQRKAALDGLITEHSFIYSRSLTGYTQFSPAQRAQLPSRRRLLVKTHPETGRKALILSSHIERIVGRPDEEGRALLSELTDFATRPKYVYSHHWQCGDIVIYDNRSVLHRARPYATFTYARDMRALRVLDGPDPDRVCVPH